ncbi:MAG: M23 family metallopeptidase [Anaerolineales bacterium]
MKLKDGLFNPRFLTCSILFVFLLAGCSQLPESCPSFTPVDLSPAEKFAGDDNLAFQFPLDSSVYEAPFSTGFATYGRVNRGGLSHYEYHAAEDSLQPAGTPVYAMADGNISFSGPMGGYGWLIIIDHPQANLYSLYGHLSPSRWRAGSGDVEKGELIAYLGDSDENGGSAEHPLRTHLHFGVRLGQRADYPDMGEWRWQAGWIKPCPQDLGWLQPSVIITSQDIPVGGFLVPAEGFVAKWGLELLFTGIYLVGGACMLAFAIKKNKPLMLVIYSSLMIAVGWVFYSKGTRMSYAIFAMAFLFLSIGFYWFIRYYTKGSRTQV